jgi:flavodoxin
MVNNKFQQAIMAVVGVALLAIAITGLGATTLGEKPDDRDTELTNDKPMTNPNSKILVVYFSRSENTERMATEIAKYYQGSLVELEAEDYRPGFLGLINAIKDSRSDRAAITPETLDLSSYQTIFIGAPIWWYSPAPPVWQFIESNDFSDKNVLLFTTFNSSFKQKYIDEFQNQIEEKGGQFIKHIYVKRGRMTQQINSETLLKKTREELDKLQL